MTKEQVKVTTVQAGRYRYPFEELRPGDGFFVRGEEKAPSLRALASRRGKRMGRRFRVSLHKLGRHKGVLVSFVLEDQEGKIRSQRIRIIDEIY